MFIVLLGLITVCSRSADGVAWFPPSILLAALVWVEYSWVRCKTPIKLINKLLAGYSEPQWFQYSIAKNSLICICHTDFLAIIILASQQSVYDEMDVVGFHIIPGITGMFCMLNLLHVLCLCWACGWRLLCRAMYKFLVLFIYVNWTAVYEERLFLNSPFQPFNTVAVEISSLFFRWLCSHVDSAQVVAQTLYRSGRNAQLAPVGILHLYPTGCWEPFISRGCFIKNRHHTCTLVR